MPTKGIFHGDDAAIRHIYRRLGQISSWRHENVWTGNVRRDIASLPDKPFESLKAEHIAHFAEVAFWTSLRTNEGRPVRFSATMLETVDASKLRLIPFSAPVPYDELQLAKLAPALPRGECFVVSAADETLVIRGFAPARPASSNYSLLARVSECGVVRVSVGILDPCVILDGRKNAILEGTARFELPTYIGAILDEHSLDVPSAARVDCFVLVDLLDAIAESGHGGTVLLVPDETDSWQSSINPFPYRFDKPNPIFNDTIRAALDTARDDAFRQMGEVISRSVAPFAAVDGAVVLTKSMQILGFGAKIAVTDDPGLSVCIYPDISFTDEQTNKVTLENCGGTRHQSAVRFAHANHNAMAIVVSQDRHVSIIHWHEPIKAVAMIRGVNFWL